MIELKKIIELLAPKKVIGFEERMVSEVLPSDEFQNMTNSSLAWLNKSNSANITLFTTGIIICDEEIEKYNFNNSCVLIIVKEPRKAFALILETFFSEPIIDSIIEKTVIIGENVSIGLNVSIGHYTILEKGCVIGNNVTIGSNNVIKRNTVIEDNVRIGSNNTIGDAGFGYEKDGGGLYCRIKHIGNVHICENVEISNNVCIDRAVLGSTVVGPNSKIDNLVHIAHGVKIGRNSLIIANSMIAGSSKIGDNVWIAPSVSILNKRTIDDNSVIGMGAVVLKDVKADTVIIGNPGRELKK